MSCRRQNQKCSGSSRQCGLPRIFCCFLPALTFTTLHPHIVAMPTFLDRVCSFNTVFLFWGTQLVSFSDNTMLQDLWLCRSLPFPLSPFLSLSCQVSLRLVAGKVTRYFLKQIKSAHDVLPAKDLCRLCINIPYSVLGMDGFHSTAWSKIRIKFELLNLYFLFTV